MTQHEALQPSTSHTFDMPTATADLLVCGEATAFFVDNERLYHVEPLATTEVALGRRTIQGRASRTSFAEDGTLTDAYGIVALTLRPAAVMDRIRARIAGESAPDRAVLTVLA